MFFSPPKRLTTLVKQVTMSGDNVDFKTRMFFCTFSREGGGSSPAFGSNQPKCELLHFPPLIKQPPFNPFPQPYQPSSFSSLLLFSPNYIPSDLLFYESRRPFQSFPPFFEERDLWNWICQSVSRWRGPLERVLRESTCTLVSSLLKEWILWVKFYMTITKYQWWIRRGKRKISPQMEKIEIMVFLTKFLKPKKDQQFQKFLNFPSLYAQDPLLQGLA